MKQTIYVDVLVILNIYVNYGLLMLTSFSIKKAPERMKILLASLFGGIYSLIILVPDISNVSVALSRLPALIIMVLIAFGYGKTKKIIKNILAFFIINLFFAGVMFVLWLFVCPRNMYYNSGVVYFSIDALTLVFFTAAAYTVIRIFSFFRNKNTPRSFSYSVALYVSGREFFFKGFYDSGNCLRDPFSGEGITVVSISVFDGFISEDIFDCIAEKDYEFTVKHIPVSSVTGTRLLPSFRAEKMVVKGIETEVIADKPVIALCKEKIHGGEYGALLCSYVFDNITN